MEHIGIFDAKTRLSEIVRQVSETGQPVTLTNRGKSLVDVVPHQGDRRRRSKAEIAAALAELQRGLPKITAADNRAAIAEGRR
jgi:prevent-host-death family protein